MLSIILLLQLKINTIILVLQEFNTNKSPSTYEPTHVPLLGRSFDAAPVCIENFTCEIETKESSGTGKHYDILKTHELMLAHLSYSRQENIIIKILQTQQ